MFFLLLLLFFLHLSQKFVNFYLENKKKRIQPVLTWEIILNGMNLCCNMNTKERFVNNFLTQSGGGEKFSWNI